MAPDTPACVSGRSARLAAGYSGKCITRVFQQLQGPLCAPS